MKITIYDLIGLIKDNKAPKRIVVFNEIMTLDKLDYVDSDGDKLFEDYEWLEWLNSEIEVLETTIHTDDLNKSNKIEKIDLYTNARCGGNMTIQEKDYNWKEISNKINEIIDKVNS